MIRIWHLTRDFNNFRCRCISSVVIPNPYPFDVSMQLGPLPWSNVIIFGAISIEHGLGIGGGGGGVGMGAERLREKIGALGRSSNSSSFKSSFILRSSHIPSPSPTAVCTLLSSAITFNFTSLVNLALLQISGPTVTLHVPKSAFQLSGNERFPRVWRIIEQVGRSLGLWCQHFWINSDNDFETVLGNFGRFPLHTELQTFKCWIQ